MSVQVQRFTSTTMNVQGHIRSSLGKKKPTHLNQCHDSDFSATISANENLQANCWISDQEGRVLGMVIPEDVLVALAEQVQALKKMSEEKNKPQKVDEDPKSFEVQPQLPGDKVEFKATSETEGLSWDNNVDAQRYFRHRPVRD